MTDEQPDVRRLADSLNHPKIAQIYGLQQNAIVMELVEGRTYPVLRQGRAGSPPPLTAAAERASQLHHTLY